MASRDPVMDYLRQFPNSYYNPAGDVIDIPDAFRSFKGIDEINFSFPPGFPSNRYKVAVEALDVATSSPWRVISHLRERVKLPMVQLGPYAKLAVLPDTEALPSFYGTVHRGGSYSVPPVMKPGQYLLKDHSMLGPS